MAGDEIDDPWPKKGAKHRHVDLPDAFPTMLLDEELPVSPRDLWRLVMADAGFFRRVHGAMQSAELRLGRWQLGESAPLSFPAVAAVWHLGKLLWSCLSSMRSLNSAPRCLQCGTARGWCTPPWHASRKLHHKSTSGSPGNRRLPRRPWAGRPVGE